MSDDSNFVVCGQDIAELKPTAELRFEQRVDPFDRNSYKVLQQKWVASARMSDGGVWSECRWRDVPTVLEHS